VSTNLRETDAVSGKQGSVQQPSAIEQILARSQSGRDMVQDFVPLAESLEWELGQEYLKERGSAAFTADANPVPYVVNNSGELSSNAAEVLYEGLEARGQGREGEGKNKGVRYEWHCRLSPLTLRRYVPDARPARRAGRPFQLHRAAEASGRQAGARTLSGSTHPCL